MNKALNKPIIKAAVIIFVCIVFISFGLMSGANGFFANLKMIFSAFFSTITFIIGISIAIFLSIIILIGLFIGATAIYSPEKAGDLSRKIWSSTLDYTEIVKTIFLKKVNDLEHSEKFNVKKEYLARQVKDLSEKMSHLSEKVKSTAIRTVEHNEKKEMSGKKSEDLNVKVDALFVEITALRQEFDQLKQTVEQQRPDNSKPQSRAVDDLPPALHILRYIDGDTDQKRLTESVNDTVQQKLSFAKARQYLEQELPDHLRVIVEKHPRLTKDFIRHQRNYFSKNK